MIGVLHQSYTVIIRAALHLYGEQSHMGSVIRIGDMNVGHQLGVHITIHTPEGDSMTGAAASLIGDDRDGAGAIVELEKDVLRKAFQVGERKSGADAADILNIEKSVVLKGAEYGKIFLRLPVKGHLRPAITGVVGQLMNQIAARFIAGQLTAVGIGTVAGESAGKIPAEGFLLVTALCGIPASAEAIKDALRIGFKTMSVIGMQFQISIQIPGNQVGAGSCKAQAVVDILSLFGSIFSALAFGNTGGIQGTNQLLLRSDGEGQTIPQIRNPECIVTVLCFFRIFGIIRLKILV